MPALRTRDTVADTVPVQLPSLNVLSPTTRPFTFPLPSPSYSPVCSFDERAFFPSPTSPPLLPITRTPPTILGGTVKRPRRKDGEVHIPRPPGAFILFRNSFFENRKKMPKEALEIGEPQQETVDLKALITARVNDLESLVDDDEKVYRPLREANKNGHDREKRRRVKTASGGKVVDRATPKISSVLPSVINDSEPQSCAPFTPPHASTELPVPQATLKPKFESSAHLDETLKRIYEFHDVCKDSYTRFMPPSTFTKSIGKRKELYLDFTSHAQELRELHHPMRGLLARTDAETKTQSQHFGKWSSTSKDIQNLLKVDRQLAKSKGTRSLYQWDKYEWKDVPEVKWLPSCLEELQMQMCLATTELKKKKIKPAIRQLLKETNVRRKWHVGRLEIIMGLLMQGIVSLEKIQRLGERVVHFVEKNMAEGFQEERGIYDEILLFGDDSWEQNSDCDGNSVQESDQSDESSGEGSSDEDIFGVSDLRLSITSDDLEVSRSSPPISPVSNSIKHGGDKPGTGFISGNQTFSRNTTPTTSTTTDTHNSHNKNTETNTHSHNVYITNHHHHHRQERRKTRWSITKFIHHHVYPVIWNPYCFCCSHYQTMVSSWLQGYWARVMTPFGCCHP